MLFKHFLDILSEVKDDNDIALEKLKSELPEEYRKYVDMVDSLPDRKKEALRARILSAGNDTIRELEKQLDYFDVTLKQ